jgi:hypothetical protein
MKGTRGIKEISNSSSSGGVTDIVNGYAILQEQAQGYYASNNFIPIVFNRDRSKRVGYSYVYPGGGSNTFNTTQINPENISETGNVISSITLYFGQVYSGSVVLANICTAALDDSFVLLSGINSNTNIFRIEINPATYAITGVVSCDTGISAPKKVEIIDASNYVNYDGQNVYLYSYDGETLSLAKTIKLDFDIIRVNAVNGYIVAIGLNKVQIINPADESVIYDEDTDDALADVVCDEKYAFVKTLSSMANPVFVYEVSLDGSVVKLPFTVGGVFPSGAVKSLVNIIKDDNVSDYQYAMAYHTDNVANIMLSIDITAMTMRSVEVGANVMAGTAQINKPQFISGNRVSFNSSVSGQPGTGYLYAYRYEYTEIEHRRNGRLYKIVRLG